MTWKSFALGCIAFTALCAASNAGVPQLSSPYRSSPPGPGTVSGAGEQRLALDDTALLRLRQAGTAPFMVPGFPVAPGAAGTLVLRRFEIAAPNARIRVTGPGGDTFLPLPEVAHFTGHLAGEPDSHVYVGAQADTLVAWVRSTAGTSYVGPDEERRGYVVRDAAAPANARYTDTGWRCETDSLPQPPAGAPAPQGEAPAIVGFQSSNVIVETDQELLAKYSGDVSAMSAYLLTLFGQFNLIYERDLSFHLTVSEIHAWTTPDPWNGPTPGDQLFQLGDWYHANRPLAQFPRATVFLTSGRTVVGGVAYVPALCIDDFDAGGGHWGGAYGMTQLYGDYPAQKWDLFSTLHEIGHNAGSHHTHCYVPPIDTCESGEPGCYVGPEAVPPGGGTIMSYCYLILPGGEDNVNLVFHPRCINEQLLPYIQSADCTAAVATFPDVPPSNPFFHYVQTIFQLGITSGCAGGNYCPSSPVTRAQMAVFLLKALEGSSYVPPSCATATFGDVPCSNPFAPWIYELAARGITGGCGGGNFCPNSTVTRKQMAPFLMKTLYGPGHVPAPCTGLFADVACTPGTGFDDFIEELYTLGITGGCATGPLRYCPENPNTRAQMAVFLVKTFHLAW